jgi:hypothetical protein
VDDPFAEVRRHILMLVALVAAFLFATVAPLLLVASLLEQRVEQVAPHPPPPRR